MTTSVVAAWLALSAGAPPLAGDWEGELRQPRRPYVVLLRIAGEGGELQGLGPPRPIEKLRADGDTLAFSVPDPPGRAEVSLARKGDRLSGTWTDGDGTFRLLLRRLPEPTRSPSRELAWAEDLDALERRFLAYDRSFDEAGRERFRAEIRSLRGRLARFDDAQVVGAMAAAVALSGNAHTRLYLVRNRTEVRRLPVRIWSFRDGWHVVAARPEHAGLAGARVIAIGGKPVEEVERAVARLYAGNRSWRRYLAAYTMTSPETLRGAGVLPAAGAVPFTLALAGGRQETVVLEPMPLARSKEPLEAWWDLAPREGWTSALADPSRPPLAARDPDTRYLAEPLLGGRALYVRYSRAGDRPGGETVEAFGNRVLDRIGPGIERVVVDLRFNTGGDLGVARGFLERLAAKAGPGRLAVLTGRATFSAGLFHALQLARAGARVVGEPVGDALTFWSEGGNVILPHSGLAAHYANGWHSYGTAPVPPGVEPFLRLPGPPLAPDAVVEPTFAEWRAGEDPVLAEALRGP